MRVRIDADACVGHGRCYALEPELFDSDDVGHAVALLDEVPEHLRAGAERAAANCPERAISLE